MHPAPTPGGVFPKIEFLDHTGTEVAAADTAVATITREDARGAREFHDAVGAQGPFLADVHRTLQRQLEVREYTDLVHDPMIPHTLALKPGLIVHSIYNGYWFWGRPSTVDLWRDLREVTREIRGDWDLTAPGLREQWDTGDRLPFHGWKDRRTVQAEAVRRRRRIRHDSDSEEARHVGHP